MQRSKLCYVTVLVTWQGRNLGGVGGGGVEPPRYEKPHLRTVRSILPEAVQRRTLPSPRNEKVYGNFVSGHGLVQYSLYFAMFRYSLLQGSNSNQGLDNGKQRFSMRERHHDEI